MPPATPPGRPVTLAGPTYRVRTMDDARIYVTVNELGGRPFEVFVRLDSPELYQWVTAVTVKIG